MMKNKSISTGTGDKGKTSWINNQRISKTDLRIKTIGNIDELNAQLGLIIALIETSTDKEKSHKLKEWIIKLQLTQNLLFDFGANLFNNNKHLEIFSQRTMEEMLFLQNKINIKELTNNHFVLPGGTIIAAQAHIARTICRRAERSLWELDESKRINSFIMIFFNRLSDFLFVLAIFENFLSKKEQIIWQKCID